MTKSFVLRELNDWRNGANASAAECEAVFAALASINRPWATCAEIYAVSGMRAVIVDAALYRLLSADRIRINEGESLAFMFQPCEAIHRGNLPGNAGDSLAGLAILALYAIAAFALLCVPVWGVLAFLFL